MRSPYLTTYRNTLVGTYNFNATQLIGFIQDWVATGPTISVNHYSAWIDSGCPVAIMSVREPECGKLNEWLLIVTFALTIIRSNFLCDMLGSDRTLSLLVYNVRYNK